MAQIKLWIAIVILLYPAFLLFVDGACVRVTRATLSSIQPFSRICNLSSAKSLNFRGVNMTGVHFTTLKSSALISFDETCILDGVVINKLLVNQDNPKKGLSYVRFQLDTPLKDARIQLIQVGGRVLVNKRIIRSNIKVFVAEGDINFTLPVTYSTFGSLKNEPAYNNFRIRFLDLVVHSNFSTVMGGKGVAFTGAVVNSRIDNIVAGAIDAGVQIDKTRKSTFSRIEADYMFITGASKCAFGELQASQFVVVKSVARSTFSKVWGKGYYTAGSYSPGSVFLSSISHSSFNNIEAGTDSSVYDHNDYEIDFYGPISDSSFNYLLGYPKFREDAPLLRSNFTLINSSQVAWLNQMTDTNFETVFARGNIYILSNLSANVRSTFGDLITAWSIAFYRPLPRQLTCSSISADKGCGVIIDRQLVTKPCPICI